MRAVRPLMRTAAMFVCAGVIVSVAGCGTARPGGTHGPGATRAATGLAGTDRPASGAGPAVAQITRFSWARLAASPLGPRSQPLVAWAGGELLELGGSVKGLTSYQGAAFDPATGRWHRIAAVNGNVNVGFANGVSAWTGRQLFVANGQPEKCFESPGETGCLPHAGLYDPATNRWTTTVLPRQLDGTTLNAAVWTGREVVLAGVDASHGRLVVAAYDPAAGRWQMITPALPSRHPSRSAGLAVAGGRLILWSLWDRVRTYPHGLSDYPGVDVFAWSSGGWRDVTGGWPQNQVVSSPVTAGSAILVSPSAVWCGMACSPPAPMGAQGYFTDPATLARTMIPAGPLGQADPAFVWTGRAIIAVNLYASIGNPGGTGWKIRPDAMALWDPATHRWLGLTAPPGGPALAATPIWTGTELLALTNGGQLLAFHH